jgi:hypothetical protein
MEKFKSNILVFIKRLIDVDKISFVDLSNFKYIIIFYVNMFGLDKIKS